MSGHALDPYTLLYEVGRQLQALPLVMRKHRLVAAQQLCECGRLPVRTLPGFGLRCEIACEQWDVVHDAMRRIVTYAEVPTRALGRVEITCRGCGRGTS
ncbi:MAG: hypothetical protein ACRDT4_19760 [Micromonosporaceae bacterium]